MRRFWTVALTLQLLLLPTPRSARGEEKGDRAKTPLFEGLGDYSRKITTTSAEAQRYFDQGLNFLFAFNHDQAIRSFEQATKFDPKAAMPYWGIAFANGPHINFPLVPPERAKAAWAALARAKANAKAGTEVEQALIDALSKRYADPQPEDRKPLDRAFADAMRDLWKKHPADAEVGAFFAESLMDLRPWDLWTLDRKAQPGTSEVVETLEAVMRLSPSHPLALHLYIHAVEASPHPEKADPAAERLRNLTPGLGHLVHMPTHIDIQRGRWQQAVESNQKAIDADRKYRKLVPEQGFYRLYMAHNHHMLAFAAVMQGESKRSLEAVREMLAAVPKEWLDVKENAMIADGFVATPVEILKRFGKWEELLKEPEPDEKFPIARTLRHAARGVAFTALGKIDEARASRKAFRDQAAKTPKESPVGNNTAGDLFPVAESLLEGEFLLKEGKTKEGLAALRLAVQAEDKLRYDEPPDWMSPVRHALGAVLLRHGDAVEAEKVYREDLRKWPDNGWSLFGLARSLEAQGKKKEAEEAEAKFQTIWKRADVKLTASCFCQAAEK